MIRRLLVAAAWWPLICAAPAGAQTVVDVVVKPATARQPAVTVRYLAIGKPGTVAAVILFAGGNGRLGIDNNGSITTNLSGNFLVRSRANFAQRNLFVAVVDTPGQVVIDGNVRLSAEYAAAMTRVIADVRQRAQVAKVWLVGTSAGTLSVVNVAARNPQTPRLERLPSEKRADGIVLTATQSKLVSGLCGKTVFNANLAAINVPALNAAHRDDGCACSPAKGATAVLAALTSAPAKEGLQFTGGNPPVSTDPCQALTPHGFLGIEDTVVAAIVDWIKTH